jgi:hypothetical protein
MIEVRAGAEVETFPSARIYGKTLFMKKSITVRPKKRGRGRPPSGGRDPMVAIRMPPDLIAEVDAWGVDNDAVRSEAIRRLVEAGLKPHAFCLSDEKAAEISAWAKTNSLSLHGAIARLVEIGLTVRTRSEPSEQQRAAIADLASQAIDSLTAGAPSNDEKASRKRRLIKGPEEFREVRVDRPKK